MSGESTVKGVSSVVERAQATKPWRAWQRYGEVRGNVLAGGMAYFAFFSLFPALALGFTVFGTIVGGDTGLQQRIADSVNDSFGTVIIGSSGVVTLDDLRGIFSGDVLTFWGVVGVVTLLFTGLGWIGAMRDGVSAVFGRRSSPNVVVAKAADFGVLVAFGVVVLASFIGGVLVTTTTGPVLDRLGLSRTAAAGVLVNVLSSLVLLAIDASMFLFLFRTLSGVRPAFDDVFTGALAGGVGIGLLKLGGGILLRVASGNRFLAAFGIVVGLLIWMNLASRVTLLASAWAATTATDRGHLAPPPEPDGEVDGRSQSEGQPERQPEVATVHGAGTTRAVTSAAPVPTYGVRAADRTTLLAGAVLGATAAIGARAVAEAGRVLRRSKEPTSERRPS